MHLSAFLIAQLVMTVAQLDTPQQILPNTQSIVVPQDVPPPGASMQPAAPWDQGLGAPFATTDPTQNPPKLPPPANNLPEYDNQRAMLVLNMNTVMIGEDFKEVLMKLERPDIQLRIFIMSRDTDMRGKPNTWADQVLNERILAKWRKESAFSGVDNYLILVWVGIEPDPAKGDFTGYFAAAVGPELERRGLTAAVLKSATGPLQITNPGRISKNPARDIPQVVRNCFSYIGPPPTWWDKNVVQLILAIVVSLALIWYGYASNPNTEEEEVCQTDEDSPQGQAEDSPATSEETTVDISDKQTTATGQEPPSSTTAKGAEDMTEEA